MGLCMFLNRLRFVLMSFITSVSCVPTLNAMAVTTLSKETAQLPNRLLACKLGHATNLDPNKNQRSDEVTFDSYHEFSLLLPAGPTRTTPPPDATEPPEPVNSATRVAHDPDGLTKRTQPGFERVIDLWPERVEMTKVINQSLIKLIVVSDIDVAAGTARMFMTDASDLTTFDFASTYLGDCTIASG